MKTLHAVCAVSLAMLTASCEQAPESRRSPDSSRPTEVRPGAFDLRFLDTMSKHHADAIAMARHAQGKVQDPELKELLQRIPPDQQAEIEQMKGWREAWYGDAAPTEQPTSSMDVSHLEAAAPGRDFDRMVMDMMISHHDDGVRMAREAVGSADHDEVRALAQRIIDKQQREIAQLQAMKSATTAAPGTEQSR